MTGRINRSGAVQHNGRVSGSTWGQTGANQDVKTTKAHIAWWLETQARPATRAEEE
jgi:hypothetical protein